VIINLPGIDDDGYKKTTVQEARAVLDEVETHADAVVGTIKKGLLAEL
jgi:hypothetical protein